MTQENKSFFATDLHRLNKIDKVKAQVKVKIFSLPIPLPLPAL